MLNSVMDGAKELLVDTITALAAAGINESEYIIIGGWCPYLLNSSAIQHPGTYDVDILFRYGYRSGALKVGIEALKSRGFCLSAKHPFQLLIEKEIKSERLIYNIDLLHPLMHEEDAALFVDHLDLDIPLNDEERRVKHVRSIVLPNSMILFDEELFTRYTLNTATFNLVNFTGMFITKMDSCRKLKRERDALDLYIALESNGIDFSLLKKLRETNERVNDSIKELTKFLQQKSDIFDSNVGQFWASPGSPAATLHKALQTST